MVTKVAVLKETSGFFRQCLWWQEEVCQPSVFVPKPNLTSPREIASWTYTNAKFQHIAWTYMCRNVHLGCQTTTVSDFIILGVVLAPLKQIQDTVSLLIHWAGSCGTVREWLWLWCANRWYLNSTGEASRHWCPVRAQQRGLMDHPVGTQVATQAWQAGER